MFKTAIYGKSLNLSTGATQKNKYHTNTDYVGIHKLIRIQKRLFGEKEPL